MHKTVKELPEDTKQYIIVKGAKVNNLKNLSVAIPRNKLVVITGVSGSGKSSLAFDTLFAEGQRMYVESLSSYARQFIGRMEKPDVEYIKGVSPAIAIEQKVSTKNPRSTVGTTTEIYDYIKLLYARVGTTYSPISGKKVEKDSVESVVNYIQSFEEGTKCIIYAPLIRIKNRKIDSELTILLQKGFTRILYDKEIVFIEDLLENKKIPEKEVLIVIDRALVRKEDENNQFRIADSVQTAFFEGQGTCLIDIPDHGTRTFSDRFEQDGLQFEVPSVNFFSFNNPYGACKRCEGFGNILGIDEKLVVPDKNLSLYEGAIAPWRSEKMSIWLQALIQSAEKSNIPIHKSYYELSEDQVDTIWYGNKFFKGIYDFFDHIEEKSHKIQYRVLLSRYRGKTTCPDCKGTRIRKDTDHVKINKKSIKEVVLMPISELIVFFDTLQLSQHEQKIAQRLLIEITGRLRFLEKVGLTYLTLNRLTSSLSGGEFQRIKLATSLGSALVGSMYILDEPSIGLHPRDTQKLIEVLQYLRDLGNTVIVVEHEEEVMLAADEIIDIGPDAGANGGHLVAQFGKSEIKKIKNENSHTLAFLKGTEHISLPSKRRKWAHHLQLQGARAHNLKNINVNFPLQVLTVITGVSGSGKSTLIKDILFPAVSQALGHHTGFISNTFNQLNGDIKLIKHVEMVDQNPIGKSSRSNPVTYVKAYDAIRQLFADQELSKARAYSPTHFSFNVKGGRCEKCEGEGHTKVEMQFMADVYITCEVCKGKRFMTDVLEVKYRNKNISDVLHLTVDEAIDFFSSQKAIIHKLLPLQEVGLGYIQLGQASNTLSGGESQRVKLATFLNKVKPEHTLFIFDEPTTGLHFHDIKKLLKAINALIDEGNSVIIIEHNLEIIKSADWVIDLGPEGGEKGGKINFEGNPEALVEKSTGYTAQYLRDKMPKK